MQIAGKMKKFLHLRTKSKVKTNATSIRRDHEKDFSSWMVKRSSGFAGDELASCASNFRRTEYFRYTGN